MSKTTTEQATPSLTRRRVFAGAGTAGVLAAAAVAVPLVRQGTPAPAAGARAEPEGSGYRETAHVLRYYETTRV